jgi:hypothetical protein
MSLSELLLSRDMVVPTQPRSPQTQLGIILAVLLLAFLTGLVFSPLVKRLMAPYEVSGSITPLDPNMVEPLEWQQVSAETAKSANAAVPVTNDPVPAAAPFIFFGSEDDKQRATDCLAATIYYEAGAEHTGGQLAVAQVVLNRMRHPAYPKSVCGVVFQGHERRTGCQFSYTCDGSMVRRRPSAGAWAQARKLANALLNGVVYRSVGTATHYHTDWVLPKWSAKLDKVHIERSHLFFRFHGFWGTPKALSGRYAGHEPRFGKLGVLSPQHRNDDTKAVEDLLLTTVDGVAADGSDIALAATSAQYAADPTMGGFLSAEKENAASLKLQVDPLLDSNTLPVLAIRACGDQANCKVSAWTDAGMIPDSDTIDHNSRNAIAFSFERKKGVKGSRARWNCVIFPRENKQECL